MIDLRLKHFAWGHDGIVFMPAPLVHVFEDEFRQGMLAIYEGYYLERPERLEDGLLQVGLIRNRDSNEVEKTKALLFSHFGQANQGPIDFNLDHFRKSFHNLFMHLRKNNIQLSADFSLSWLLFGGLFTLPYQSLGRRLTLENVFLRSWTRMRSRADTGQITSSDLKPVIRPLY